MPDVPFFRKAKYSPGDGMGFGLGSHTLDQALQLFGTPKCVTGFLRVLRDFKSEVEDTYTVLLQYENPLLVTIKSTIISSMQHQLKYFFRGTQGSFVKYDTDAQENQILSGMKPTDDNFAFDTEDQWGVLTTRERFESWTIDQSYDRKQSQWTGRYKTFRGWCQGFITMWLMLSSEMLNPWYVPGRVEMW